MDERNGRIGPLRTADWSRIDTESGAEEFAEYVKEYKQMPGSSHTPFNLGIYYSTSGNELRAAQFAGIMPLLRRKGDLKNEAASGPPHVVVYPRFRASAVRMLQTVLDGDDFFELSGKVRFKEYAVRELLSADFNDVLFGMAADLPEIELHRLFPGDDGDAAAAWEHGLDLADCCSLFEVWDYLAKLHLLCKKALKHQSELVEENLTGKVKGKIQLRKQLRHNLSKGRVDRVYCTYNRLSADNPENRILKYALHLCDKFLAGTTAAGLQDKLIYCKRALSAVSLRRCTLSSFREVKHNGVFTFYKPALAAAEKLMRGFSGEFQSTFVRSAGTDGGLSSIGPYAKDKKIKPFFINMNLLFELYARRIVERMLPAGCSLRSYAEPIELYAKDRPAPRGFSRELIPDIVIRSGMRTVAVIDAKYSPLEYGNRERTHQILSYMFLLDCRVGGFASPQLEREEPESAGNPYFTGVHIPIDLSGKNGPSRESLDRLQTLLLGGVRP